MKDQLTVKEALEQVRVAYEQENIQLTVHISTLQVSINQQAFKINTLEKELEAKEVASFNTQDCYG